MARSSTFAWAAAASLSLIVACGDSAVTTTGPAAPPPTTAPTTTVPAPTTTVPAPTTAPAPTTTVAPTTTQAPATTTTTQAPTTTVDTNTLASGSGCTPGPGALPDGRWFGTIVDADGDTVEFDLACWFSGDAAVLASAEDGEESPPPNDYHIRNVNPTVRDVPVGASAAVRWLENPGSADLTDITYADWLASRLDRFFQPNAWLEVKGGEITLVEEQYQP